jgi:transcriptional regulator with GAF, ATPase, and Fis domain
MVREVESIERAVPSNGENFDEKDFCLQDEIQRYEADLIRSALVKAQGRQRRAARILGVKVTTLSAKIKKYDINWRVIGVESDFVS